jgi:hypothetical protein
MAEGRELHEMIETGKRWVEHVRHRSAQCPATASPPYRTKTGTDVEQRRHLIVALLHHHQDGLTAREIREAIGLSRSLTDSAISGLFIRGVVHKHGHRYVLAAQDDPREH